MVRAGSPRFGVVAVVATACLAAACGGRGDDAPAAHGAPGRPAATPPPAGSDGEQARFDAERRPELIVAALGIGSGARVADVGAGSGLLTVHVARAVRPGGRVVATDIDGGVLELLAARLADAGLADVVERRVVTGDAPGLDAASFDAILLSEVDHYFAAPAAWLRAAGAALRPGGRIVITNRVYRRSQALAAAAAAGLVLTAETAPEPAHFLATFTLAPTAPPASAPPAAKEPSP